MLSTFNMHQNGQWSYVKYSLPEAISSFWWRTGCLKVSETQLLVAHSLKFPLIGETRFKHLLASVTLPPLCKHPL